MAVVVRMPSPAAGVTEAIVRAWLVEPGAEVVTGQALLEIETDKAMVEYEAEDAGTFAGSLVEPGATVTVGSPIAVLVGPGEDPARALAAARGGDEEIAAGQEEATEQDGASAAEPAPAAPDPGSEQAPATPPEQAPARRPDRLRASPLVRKLARERGIDLGEISGSGPHGRIVRRDLAAHLEMVSVAQPTAEPAGSGPAAPAQTAPSPAPLATAAGYTDHPLTGMRRAIARRLTESKSTVPHYYLSADLRVDELLRVRASINETAATKVSVNDLILKAVAGALTAVPEANAIWTDTAIRQFDGADLAVAVSTPGGLLTPVVRGVDRLTLTALAAQVRDLAERARTGSLKQHELEGGSFTVSNLGMYGTQEFAAIINPPHSGILAVGAATPRAVVDSDGHLIAARVMTVTLSADHRVVDGALAAQWLAAFVARVENPVSILI